MWDDATQHRFDQLRLKALTSELSAEEADELALLHQEADSFANDYLAQAVLTLQEEQTQLNEQLQKNEHINEALRVVQTQQETLLQESRQWLVDFQRRHGQLMAQYNQITGNFAS